MFQNEEGNDEKVLLKSFLKKFSNIKFLTYPDITSIYR